MAKTLNEKTSAASLTSLDALFGGKPLSGFLEENWPGTPRVFHHDEHLAPELWHLPDLQSLDDVLDVAAPGTIFANLPDHDEEYNQIRLSDPADVKKAFACKMGISLEPDLSRLTELIFWLRGIQRDLGLSGETYGRCNIYAIPAGGRTACHYDQNINIVCQITGEKVWELAPNTHVVNPDVRHTMGTPPERSTAAYAKGKLPSEMPAEGRLRVVLKPGSVLFVPRGWWHQTSSAVDSIALNFTYDQLSWAQVASAALCQRLMREEKWRGVAYGLQMEGPLREKAEAEFAALMKEAGQVFGSMNFSDLS